MVNRLFNIYLRDLHQKQKQLQVVCLAWSSDLHQKIHQTYCLCDILKPANPGVQKCAKWDGGSDRMAVHVRRGSELWSLHHQLVVWNLFLFSHILGISSSQLTFTPSFFRGVRSNHQAVWSFIPSCNPSITTMIGIRKPLLSYNPKQLIASGIFATCSICRRTVCRSTSPPVDGKHLEIIDQWHASLLCLSQNVGTIYNVSVVAIYYWHIGLYIYIGL